MSVLLPAPEGPRINVVRPCSAAATPSSEQAPGATSPRGLAAMASTL